MKLLSPNGWTGRQLAALPVLAFYAAVDRLEDDSVPQTYYEKVVGRRAEELARNGSQPRRFAR